MITNNRKAISIIIVLLLFLMIGGFDLSLYLLYSRSLDALDQSLGDRLLSVGRAVSPEVESVISDDLAYGTLSLTNLIRMQDYLEQIRNADDLSGVYLLDPTGRDLLALDDSPSRIDLFLSLHAEAISHAALGQAGTSQLYRVDTRYFKSAYQPVGKDSVIAVLLIESSFDFFRDFDNFQRQILVINSVALIMLIIVGVVIVVLNRQLIKAEKMLVSQAALSQMGQMTAIIAHEVRNPLAIIKATAERLKKKYGAAGTPDEQLFDFIPEEVDRLNQITTQYLQFAAPTDIQSKPEPLGNTITSVVDGMRSEFEQRGVTLIVHCEPQVGEVLVESQQIRQILVNLLRNALDATPAAGRVEVSCRLELSGMVSVSISDTGKGLDKKEQKRIFDPFFTTKLHGTGLGLFVVRQLVDKLKGKIEVESQPGVGTKFVIIFRGYTDGKNSRS
ncbi:MAG: ATP-binding protein [Candidatus Zixiibacteriota bacterium]